MAEEYGNGVPMVLNPQMGAIDATVESIRYRAQLIARNQKLDSGVMSTGMIGFAGGFLFALLMVIILPLMVGL
ncbi:MAG: tetrahydromethanopterin S-methyltransferase subunit F [Methanosarcina sp.]|uniref:tetrahydromethanopterin S-methyltransferase subunit F n=1 Tax=Methanosarcina sp. TaxID=2213 RepID=UPI00260ACD4D|nr:tetrahydromethanopterin S-methyltransferase subunit F [Methanosarcina sp.]MDD3245906.1 tetrahydromethanopterin S-methyltransferase subunit F [Methanosarcina sp.]MDD4249684.1 tetrahydromethanopterin S-methyltransferase subunit F [Methanosarcina sp.]